MPMYRRVSPHSACYISRRGQLDNAKEHLDVAHDPVVIANICFRSAASWPWVRPWHVPAYLHGSRFFGCSSTSANKRRRRRVMSSMSSKQDINKQAQERVQLEKERVKRQGQQGEHPAHLHLHLQPPICTITRSR